MISIDCDVHNDVPRVQALFPYLPAYWVEHINNTMFKGPTEPYYPPGSPVAARPEARLEDGSPAGSDLLKLQQQVLDEPGVDIAILNCLYAVDSLHNPDAAIALATAVNDWLIAEWLDKDSRLRASIVVPSQLPAQAAREIDRVADHPGFVQVLIPARTQHPLGSRLYHPLW
ncbi:MAG: amidohydrolase family protein, partial [Chloroflexi bacterium]|nr:amidohydrolase family protein [Chloroflexota bacterium]